MPKRLVDQKAVDSVVNAFGGPPKPEEENHEGLFHKIIAAVTPAPEQDEEKKRKN